MTLTESQKSWCWFVALVAIIITCDVWCNDRPTASTWVLRITTPLIGLAAIAGLLLPTRSDPAPDYLAEIGKTAKWFLECDGFCFLFRTTVFNDVCYLEAYFQNRFENECVGRIALRPRSFSKLSALTYEVRCLPAAFGVQRIPIPVPESQQGRRSWYDVASSVKYPQGKGKGKGTRYSNGIRISNSTFDEPLTPGVTTEKNIAGWIKWHGGRAEVRFPNHVAETVPDGLQPHTVTLWKWDDPLLEGSPLDVAKRHRPGKKA